MCMCAGVRFFRAQNEPPNPTVSKAPLKCSAPKARKGIANLLAVYFKQRTKARLTDVPNPLLPGALYTLILSSKAGVYCSGLIIRLAG